jgi:hypothetical protein
MRYDMAVCLTHRDPPALWPPPYSLVVAVHQLLGLLLAVHLPAAIVPRYACEGSG